MRKAIALSFSLVTSCSLASSSPPIDDTEAPLTLSPTGADRAPRLVVLEPSGALCISAPPSPPVRVSGRFVDVRGTEPPSAAVLALEGADEAEGRLVWIRPWRRGAGEERPFGQADGRLLWAGDGLVGLARGEGATVFYSDGEHEVGKSISMPRSAWYRPETGVLTTVTDQGAWAVLRERRLGQGGVSELTSRAIEPGAVVAQGGGVVSIRDGWLFDEGRPVTMPHELGAKRLRVAYAKRAEGALVVLLEGDATGLVVVRGGRVEAWFGLPAGEGEPSPWLRAPLVGDVGGAVLVVAGGEVRRLSLGRRVTLGPPLSPGCEALAAAVAVAPG